MTTFYVGKTSITTKLQQNTGDLEFQSIDTVGGRVFFDVRQYSPDCGWEFKGRIEVSLGPDLRRRAWNLYEYGEETPDFGWQSPV